MKRLLLITVTVMMTSLASLADVTINSTNFPDANFRSYLMSQYPSGYITTAQLNARDSLNLMSKRISDLKGVEYFTQLTYLNCYSNYLTSIDVSSNTKLKYLNVAYNRLTSINVTANTALEQLYLQSNQLTELNANNLSRLRTLWVFDNSTLTYLKCIRNNLSNFDVAGCTALTELRCYENSLLSTIKGLADCTAITHLDCEDCAITDLSAVNSMSNLKTLLCRNNHLTTLTVTNKYNLTSIRANGNTMLTKLDCNSCALTSLSIGDCTAMTELSCYNNSNLGELTGLASCTALKKLVCYSCALTDLSALNSIASLTNLVCSGNKLTSLTLINKPNLSQLWVDDNTLLTRVDCNNNNLTNFNVTGCTQLDSLNCRGNGRLASITGLADCANLRSINCNSCALTNLDGLAGKTRLQRVSCSLNHLESLDFTGCNSLNTVICVINEILEYGMSTLVNSLPTRPSSSPGTLIAMYNGPEENNDLTDELAIEAYNKHWGVFASVGSGIEPIVSLDKALNQEGGDIHFTTGGDYPWVLAIDAEGRIYAKSSNEAVSNSTSTLTATVNVTMPNVFLITVFKAMGEGSTYGIYDECRFSIDGNEVYSFGDLLGDCWNTNSASLSMGVHTLTWTYTKDNTVNPVGDFFAVDEVYLEMRAQRGDVNNDGSVSIADVTALIDYLLSGDSSAINWNAADMNGDTDVSISDVTELIDYLLSGK